MKLIVLFFYNFFSFTNDWSSNYSKCFFSKTESPSCTWSMLSSSRFVYSHYDLRAYFIHHISLENLSSLFPSCTIRLPLIFYSRATYSALLLSLSPFILFPTALEMPMTSFNSSCATPQRLLACPETSSPALWWGRMGEERRRGSEAESAVE